MHGVIIEGNTDDYQGQSNQVWVIKTGRIIMQNMKHIRHTPVTVRQYLRDQITKSRTWTMVTSWSTNDISYNPYMARTHVHELWNHMRHSDSDECNEVHINSDRDHKIMETQLENIGINNANMHKLSIIMDQK